MGRYRECTLYGGGVDRDRWELGLAKEKIKVHPDKRDRGLPFVLKLKGYTDQLGLASRLSHFLKLGVLRTLIRPLPTGFQK